MDYMPTVRDSGEGDQQLDVGIAVVQQSQNAVADMPDPFVADDFPTKPWVWRARYRIYAVAVDDQNVHYTRVDLDLRGKRKLENGRLVYLMTNNDQQGTSTPIVATGIIRQLYLVG